ncbi:MAG: MATE family efflux transporter [Sphaerochaetaceae bacterium]|nr:MATE family efflux transporter [Sphaerochaetaceae bacterium]
MFKNKNFQQLLDENFTLAPILKLAIPITITSIIQSLYNLIDTYWLGKLGINELAAINLVTPIQQTIIAFGSGITVAGAILISQNLGARKIELANKIVAHILTFTISFALLSCIIILSQSTNILIWLGAEDNIFQESKMYLDLILFGMPLLYILNIYTSVSQSQGNSFYPMLLNLLGSIINIILDPYLIIHLEKGIYGAGLATLISKGTIALISIILLLKSKQNIKIKLKYFKIDLNLLKKILFIALPISFGNSTMQFGFILMSKIVLSYGPIAMAAYGVGNKINGLISLPVQGISSALATVVGQYVGKENHKKIRKSYIISRRICLIFLLFGGIILSRKPISSSIVKVFTNDINVIDMGSTLLSILALFSFTNAIHNTTRAVFNGEGFTKIAVLSDVLRIWIFRFLSVYFLTKVFALGVVGIWYSIVISNGLAALFSISVYTLKIKNKKVKTIT